MNRWFKCWNSYLFRLVQRLTFIICTSWLKDPKYKLQKAVCFSLQVAYFAIKFPVLWFAEIQIKKMTWKSATVYLPLCSSTELYFYLGECPWLSGPDSPPQGRQARAPAGLSSSSAVWRRSWNRLAAGHDGCTTGPRQHTEAAQRLLTPANLLTQLFSRILKFRVEQWQPFGFVGLNKKFFYIWVEILIDKFINGLKKKSRSFV